MNFLSDTVVLSRVQFAITALFHMLWKSILVALTLIQGYVLIGSTYLILKTEGELQSTHY